MTEPQLIAVDDRLATPDFLLEVRDLSIRFVDRDPVVRDVSFGVRAGEMLGLVGESGSGKTMSLLAILGLVDPRAQVSGEIWFGGDRVSGGESLRRLRGRHVALVFQDPLSALNPSFTIGWQIEESLRLQRPDLSGAERRRRVYEVMDEVGLPQPRRLAGLFPHEFSGGMRQRALLALALAGDPEVLLADEPTTALDVTLAAEILDLLDGLRRLRTLGVILVSHDLNLVASRCDRVVVMYAGVVVETARAASIFSTPAHPYTRALLRATVDPFVDAVLPPGSAADPLDALPGVVGCPFALRCPYSAEVCRTELLSLAAVGADDEPSFLLPPAVRHPNRVIGNSPAGQSLPQAHSGTAVLAARGVSVAYRTIEPGRFRSVSRTFDAVADVTLEIEAGERVAVVGESGSGKSTLGRALVGLQPIRKGRIEFSGREVRLTDRRAVADLRRHVQIVFQDPYSSLNPRMSVGTALDRVFRITTDLGQRDRTRLVLELLESVGLSISLSGRYPHQLSGGQRQRVAIARALAGGPSVLVADEPTSSLDVSVQAQILSLLDRIVRERHLAVIFVTHDFGVVRAMAERVAVMHLGKIVEEGPVGSVIADPRHPYTRALLSAVPSPSRRGQPRTPLIGRPLSSTNPPTGCRLHPRCPFATERCALEEPHLNEVAPGRQVACHYSTATERPWSTTPSQIWRPSSPAESTGPTDR